MDSKPLNQQRDAYFELFYRELAREIEPNTTIKRFASNSEVIGAYAEQAVARLVRRMVYPLRVSTGAVISPEQSRSPEDAPQVDLIIWSPNPLPAIYEAGDFALVPLRSVFGVLEVKRSNYAAVGAKIKRALRHPWTALAPGLATRIKVTGEARKLRNRLGVVCLREHSRVDHDLEELITTGEAVCLMQQDGEDYHADTKGLTTLVNVLQDISVFAAHRINWLNPAIGTRSAGTPDS